MTKTEFATLVTKKLRHVPTKGQKEAIVLFTNYLACRDKEAVMLYAGTGKTTLVSAFVAALDELKISNGSCCKGFGKLFVQAGIYHSQRNL
jgi:hypothetical protein